MKIPKISTAIEFIDDDLIAAATDNKEKPFYITATFKRAVAVAVCLVIVTITAFSLTAKPDSVSEINSQNKKVIYVTENEPITFNDSSESLHGTYISPKLKEKMELYKDYKEAIVVYHVSVRTFAIMKDYEEAEKAINANKKAQKLFEQKETTYQEYKRAYNEYYALITSMDGVNDLEKVDKINYWLPIAGTKQQEYNDLKRKWENLYNNLRNEFINKKLKERLEFASQLSEKTPVVTSDYNSYIMDLTAKEINVLAKKGGYAFKFPHGDGDYMLDEENSFQTCFDE